MDEDRLGTQPAADTARRKAGSRKPPAARAAPAVADEPAEDQQFDEGNDPLDEGDLTDEEMFAAFADSLDQSVLPTLPEMPGFHVCWLSTTNSRDTIPNRLRMGYELIKPEMVPGFVCDLNPKSAPHPGVISINEMVAARIPSARYQRMMAYVHHQLPLAEEAKMRNALERKKQEAEEVGGRIIEGDGMASLGKRVPVPKFA